MSRQHRISVLLLAVFLLALVSSVGMTLAQDTPQQPSVQPLCSYALKSGIPFAWLRFQPSSFAGYSITLLPGQTVTLNNPPTLTWDGTQWWAYVWPNASPANGYYWVELSSIEPRCVTATPTPTPFPDTPTPPTPVPGGAAPWQQGNTVRVRFNVPFVWFRAAPAPGNQPIYTVFPGTNLVVMGGPAQDSFGQWWWLMRDPRNGVTGWVEQNTTELVSGGPGPGPVTPVPPTWQIGDTVRIRAAVPFSWMRFTPDSQSGIVFTVYPGQQLILQQGPQSDNVQNWWKVIIPNTAVTGWVEAGSLEFVRR